MSALAVSGLVALAPSAQALPSNCKADSDLRGYICVTVTSDKKNSTFKAAWSEVLVNDTNRKATFECEAETSKTWKAGISASISAEAGVIFAKVDSQVGFNLEYSRASGKKTKAGIVVPAHGRTLCERGVYVHVFKGTLKHYRCTSRSCRLVEEGTFKVKAPSRAGWRLRDL